ncbi:MAG: SUMF1/EgtB/PvdO family nonheme iron enzyme [Methylococcales bacterium]|nr:SUMF1/EgtB/PvdO family nonheme iron enzyme [Methylococcales bacterium]
MADIFLSYSRQDQAKAKLFVTALEQEGWTVFWDTKSILGGQDFDAVIEAAIEAAACMVVLWSEVAKKSHYVRDEARLGRERNILVPVLIESISLPLGFGSLHAENFSSWQGDINAPEFIKLQQAITLKLSLYTPDLASKPADDDTVALPTPQPTPVAACKTLAYIEPELVLIPAGRFMMGSNEYENEQPIHPVTLAHPFYLGKYPVTFAEYALFVQATQRQLPNDEGWGKGKRPVINVSWQDANNYAAWLSAQTGNAYRLPTEAEWEYACRARANSRFYWGDNGQLAADYACFWGNSDGKTHSVGEKRPNAWGLYDMAGNVWEWVQDGYSDNYQQAQNDGKPYESANCAARVVRGGSWFNEYLLLRSANRFRIIPDLRSFDIGFRLAQD